MEQEYKISKKIAQYISNIMRGKKHDGDVEIQEWIKSTPHSNEAIDLFTDEIKFTQAVESFDKSELCEKSLLKFKQTILKRKQNRRKLTMWKVASVAVVISIVTILTQAISHYINEDNFSPLPDLKSELISKKIEVPTLVLDNGENIQLDKTENIVGEKGKKIVKITELEQSSSSYNTVDGSHYIPRINTLIIPSRYTYSLILSDGTKVTLNANSTLIYPTVFGADSRSVTLEGEGYFEVAKSIAPFFVSCNGVQIKVYGTKFNINSYDYNNVKTVLLSGSVGVSMKNREEYILKPNQLININVNFHTVNIKDVEATDYIDWNRGIIKSYDAELGDLIDKLSNWYGLHFDFYDNTKRTIPITASFYNNQTIESIIASIEYSIKIKFIKNERGYIIH